MIVFNNIVCPFLSYAFLSSSCFRDVFFEQEAVESTYNYANGCTIGSFITGFIKFTYSQNTVSYQPPYVYSYECGSSFLSAYLPVFISIYLWRFGMVLFQIALYRFTSRIVDMDIDSRINQFVTEFTHPLLRPMNILKQKYAEHSRGLKANVNWRNVPELVERSRTQSIWILNGLSMLTIGVTFPPFAVMACFDTFMDFILLRCFVGHFVCKVEELENNDEKLFYKHLLKRDLRGMGSCFKNWRLVVFALQFSSLYFFIFLYDITGSSEGAAYGSIVPVILICLSSLMSVSLWYYPKWELMTVKPKEIEDDAIELSKVEKNNVESNNMNPIHEVVVDGK